MKHNKYFNPDNDYSWLNKKDEGWVEVVLTSLAAVVCVITVIALFLILS